MPSINEVASTVRQVLANDFETIEIIDVRVTKAEDSDGDEILKVEVIFEAGEKALDARKVSGVIRHLRPKLSEIGEYRFPLMSFVSRADSGLGRLAPA